MGKPNIHGPYPIPMDVTLIHMGVGSAERHGVTFHSNSGLIPLSAIGNSINPFRKLVSLSLPPNIHHCTREEVPDN